MQVTLFLAILSISICLASFPQKFFTPSLMQICFNSGVSMPLNLIFSPLILIVSPSVILRFCDLTSV